MEISYKEEGKEVRVNVTKVSIHLGDVDFYLKINNWGELVLNKQQFGDGISGLNIAPSVSNEIIIS